MPSISPLLRTLDTCTRQTHFEACLVGLHAALCVITVCVVRTLTNLCWADVSKEFLYVSLNVARSSQHFELAVARDDVIMPWLRAQHRSDETFRRALVLGVLMMLITGCGASMDTDSRHAADTARQRHHQAGNGAV